MTDERQWHCLACRTRMHRELAAPTQKAVGKRVTVAHMCGTCKTVHIETPDGNLRLLTDAELASVHAQMPKAMRAIRQTELPAANMPTGLLFFPEGDNP